MAIADKILNLTKQLYSTGRAVRIFFQSILEKLHIGLGASEARAYQDAVSILDSALPDNSNFAVDDATAWEGRLGLITNNAVSLSNRILAIKRKMNHPGTIKARQNYLYVQGQLQAAGFNVYVFENVNLQFITFLPPTSWIDEIANLPFDKTFIKLAKNASASIFQSMGAAQLLPLTIPQGTTVIFSFKIKTIGIVNPGIYYVAVRFWDGNPNNPLSNPCDNANSFSGLTSPNEYNETGIFTMTNGPGRYVEILCGLPTTPSSGSVEIYFSSQSIQLGDAQLGDFQLGESSQVNNLIANHIEESLDEIFNIGINLKSTFIIGGTPIGTIANIDKNRKDEFRQLVLKLKPVQEIALLFINYI